MRLCPEGHPLAEHFRKWPHLQAAKKYWRSRVKAVLLELQDFFSLRDHPAYARIRTSNITRLDCFFKAADDRLGWMNLRHVAEFPSYAFLDGPMVCTVALNCLAPAAGMVLYDWMRYVGCWPPLNRPCPLADADGVPVRTALTDEDADLFMTPENYGVVHCLLPELGATTKQLAKLQLDWLDGGGPKTTYDEAGLPVPWVRWTTKAWEVYDAWKTLQSEMDEGAWELAMRSATHKRKGKPKKCPGDPKKSDQMQPQVKKCFLRTGWSVRHRIPKRRKTTP